MITLDLAECTEFGKQGWAAGKAKALKQATDELRELGHTLGAWESTSPGYQFLAGCCCLKCGRIYLAQHDGVRLVPEPSSRIHAEQCAAKDWVSAQEAAALLGVDLKRLRKWLRVETVSRQSFTVRNGLPSCETTWKERQKRVPEYLSAPEIEALRPRIRHRSDKLGRQYVELLKAEAVAQ